MRDWTNLYDWKPNYVFKPNWTLEASLPIGLERGKEIAREGWEVEGKGRRDGKKEGREREGGMSSRKGEGGRERIDM